MDEFRGSRISIGIMDVVQIIFIVLQCIGMIHWKWWQVMMPTFISLVVCLIYLGVLYVAEGEGEK